MDRGLQAEPVVRHQASAKEDSTYKAGQRLVVAKSDVENLLMLLEKLGNGLGDACGRA